MGKITPKLTLTSNASGASTDPGPLSIALSLSATDLLDVTKVETKLFTIKPGEFAWMPWDCTYDIYVDANGTGAAGLETWAFVRTTTA